MPGWRVIHVWDEFLDRAQDPWDWTRARAEAAAAYAGEIQLVIAKSLTTRAAPLASERGWPAVWLTPLFENEIVEALRARAAPALFVGGTADEAWDGVLARGLSPDVLELEGADHGLASVEHAAQIGAAVAEFSGRLLGRA
jgi:hypothetical protein